MNNESLLKSLYKKMCTEQGEYRDWLLSQEPKEILRHAHEFTVREDTIMLMERLVLSSGQAIAMLSVPSLVSLIEKAFQKVETDYLEMLGFCIESCGKDIQAAEKELPLYLNSVAYASEHQEVKLFWASKEANMHCKMAIESAINDHYHDYCLGDEAVKEVTAHFSIERILFVLAITVRQMEWDGRISSENKAWAQTVAGFDGENALEREKDGSLTVLGVNPGLTDIFLSQVRREFVSPEKKTSDDVSGEAEQ